MKARKMSLGVLILTLLGCSQTAKTPEKPMIAKGQVIEFAPIVLKEEVSETVLVEASHKLQEEFLVKQKGFLKRELVKQSAKEYADFVYWDSRENAENAALKAMESPVCLEFFQLMEMPDSADASTGITYYELLGSY